MITLELEAPAKINLGLAVLGKRPDGYHDIRSVMHSVSLADRLFFRKSAGGIAIESDNSALPTGPENLVFKAWSAVCRKVGGDLGVRVRLSKRIPVAGGLAGGSSDAAATIIALNRLFDLGLSLPEMEELAAGIGSDVPFCLRRGAALVEGRGEVLKPLKCLPETQIILVNPGIPILTGWAYDNLRNELTGDSLKIDYLVKGLRSGDLRLIAGNLYNSFEPLVFSYHELIKEVKSRLLKSGAIGASLSGSGPSVFGIFDFDVDPGRFSASGFPGDLEVYKLHPVGEFRF